MDALKKSAFFSMVWMIFSTTSAAAGGIYKCTDPATGQIVFSQTQCATDASRLDVTVSHPTAAQAEEHEKRMQEMIRQSNAIDRERAKENVLSNHEERLQNLLDRRALEIQAVQKRRSYAMNNLAGATWETALSQDVANINAYYQPLIDAEQREIERLSH